MRTIKHLILICLLMALSLSGSWRRSYTFLVVAGVPTAINLNAGLTATNGTEFNSAEIDIRYAGRVSITIAFTRAAGAADTLDFSFEASYDNGNSWATFEGVVISVATNHSVISGTTVIVLTTVNAPGISHIRVKDIVNNDGVNNLTAINVILSY